jgi:NADPH:quinone reductase-like Zn-dependent oxidoreductase
MKAFTFYKYGGPDVLGVEELPTPAPAAHEVLIRVRAAGVNAYDWRLMSANPFLVRISGMGLFRPKNPLLGADVAGIVESVGPGVTHFVPGDAVFGSVSPTGNGGFAEYVCANEAYLAPMPANASFEEAAAIPMAALTALQGLRDAGKLESGQHVAINGASGGVGSFAVQIAHALGAELTAVCSTAKADLVRSLGADHVVDYTTTDFTEGSPGYDLILAVNGFHPIKHYRRALAPTGTYVMAGGSTRQIMQALMHGSRLSEKGGRTLTRVDEHPNSEDLIVMEDLVEAGKVRSVIDRAYPFDSVPEAIGHVMAGHAAGKVVVSVSS